MIPPSEKMLNKIFEKNNCKFTFEVNTIQEMLKNGFKGIDFTKAKMFAMDDELLVKNYIETNYQESKR